MSQLSASSGTILSPVPGWSVTSVSRICWSTYVELASSTSAESVRLMSPGIATTSVPPGFGVTPVDAAGADDPVADGPVATGAPLGDDAAFVQAEAASTRVARNATDRYRNIFWDSSCVDLP